MRSNVYLLGILYLFGANLCAEPPVPVRLELNQYATDLPSLEVHGDIFAISPQGLALECPEQILLLEWGDVEQLEVVSLSAVVCYWATPLASVPDSLRLLEVRMNRRGIHGRLPQSGFHVRLDAAQVESVDLLFPAGNRMNLTIPWEWATMPVRPRLAAMDHGG